MKLSVGETIRALRRRDGRTQEALAEALGVTGQAVSRWEAGGSYPDLELIPAIAHFFGVSIDELFGYTSERDKKIDAVIARIDAFGIRARGDDGWVDECLSLLREALAEFPQNERLLITLADTLSEAGWRRHHEWVYYDEEGYMQHGYDKHKSNAYWTEAVKICERLLETTHDNAIYTRAIHILVLLYRNFGATEKALACAARMPALRDCRELLRASAADGKAEAEYVGEALLEMASSFSSQLVYGLICNRQHYETDMPIEKVKGAIALFSLLCDDGNLGPYHGKVIQLYLYLSRLQWERGNQAEAFASLDEALAHARALEALSDGQEHRLTAPLVRFVRYQSAPAQRVAAQLPEDWPFWCNPDPTQTAQEMQRDPRWADWVRRTQN